MELNQEWGHDLFSECLACAHYGCEPRQLAIDVLGTSSDEADALCALHRARMTEGACVLCGRRRPWVGLHETSDVAACRPCFASTFGEGEAKRLENAWAELERLGSL